MRRSLRTAVTATLTTTALLLGPLAAHAGTVVTDVSDDVQAGCTGTRHSPATGHPDSFSALLVALLLAAAGIDQVTLSSTDGSGTTTETTVPVEDGVVATELPLVSYGPGTLTATADGAPIDLGPLATFDITDDEPPCDRGMLPAPDPEPTEAATATDAPSEPASEAPVDEATDAPATDPAPVGTDGGGFPWGPGLLILLGGGAVVAGGTRTRRRTAGGGTTTDDDEDDEDDDPRDAPPPVLYGEEVETAYAYEVKLVTAGNFTDLASPGNTTQTLLAAPPGNVVVGTYFVAFTTQITQHEGKYTHSVHQMRKLQGIHGEAEAAVEDADEDLWFDYWQKYDVRRHGYGADTGDGQYASASTEVKVDGWTSRESWTSDAASNTRYADVPVKTGKPVSDATSDHRQLVRMSVQFRPEGPAAGRDDHLFRGEGSSSLELETESECAWCKDSTAAARLLCNPTLAAAASGGFDVEAEALHGSTTFRYTNETDQARITQIGAAGNVGASVATPKVGVAVGPVTITEVQLTLKPSEKHNTKTTFPKVSNRDQFDHAQTLRCTIRAASSSTCQATVTQEADTHVTAMDWAMETRAKARVDHDITLHGEVGSTWPFPCRPSLTVRLDETEDRHASVVVDGNPVPLHSPLSTAVGTHWWQLGPIPRETSD